MQSATLSGEVQQRGSDGIWRTILTASGHSVVDNWKMPHDWRATTRTAPYVPGRAGASMPPPAVFLKGINIY